jgi:hypothetical protein
VHDINYINETEMHTSEPVEPEPSYFVVEVAIETLNPCIEQIPAN